MYTTSLEGLLDEQSCRWEKQIRNILSHSCCLLLADAHVYTVQRLCCDTTVIPIGIPKMHIS
jgi:hypothetical protein